MSAVHLSGLWTSSRLKLELTTDLLTSAEPTAWLSTVRCTGALGSAHASETKNNCTNGELSQQCHPTPCALGKNFSSFHEILITIIFAKSGIDRSRGLRSATSAGSKITVSCTCFTSYTLTLEFATVQTCMHTDSNTALHVYYQLCSYS